MDRERRDLPWCSCFCDLLRVPPPAFSLPTFGSAGLSGNSQETHVMRLHSGFPSSGTFGPTSSAIWFPSVSRSLLFHLGRLTVPLGAKTFWMWPR